MPNNKTRLITRKMQTLDRKGQPAIFFVTGNNSTGKTTITRKLIQELPFYQAINLGLASKMIRLFRPDIAASELENFDGNEASSLFKQMVNFIVDSYQDTGVNVILEGVQIDPRELAKKESILGGVILKVEDSAAIQRGKSPETHFNRQIKQLKNITYVPNSKFKTIDNNGKVEDTFRCVLAHLEQLLDSRLAKP